MKHRGGREWEIHFRRVEDPQDHDVVPARAQVAEPCLQGIGRGQQVGNQDDQPALAHGGGDLLERLHEVGRAARGLTLERRHQPAEMAGPVPRRQVLGDSILKQKQADRVALRGQKIGDRRRRGARVVALAVSPGSIAHRPAGVDHEMAAEVGLVLEPFHVIAVGAREQPPVEIARVVARAVFAVLAEFDREPVVRAAVDALDKSLDRDPRPHFQALDAHQRLRIDQRCRRTRAGSSRRRDAAPEAP